MKLSLAGTRFSEADLSSIGRLLFVRVDLPEGPIEVVVKIVTSAREGEETKKKWILGVSILKISADDIARLDAYLEKRLRDPVFISD